MRNPFPFMLLALNASLGCAADFDSQAELSGLRALAVQKSVPYGRPGETIDLKLLWHDGAGEGSRPIQIAWVAECFNPLGDLFETCFDVLPDGASGFEIATGTALDTFSFTMPSDIISSRPPSRDPDLPRFGTAFVFFALCAGEFVADVAPGTPNQSQFPLACRDDNQRLGSGDFVVGYSQTFAYDELANHNPLVRGFEVEGEEVGVDCLGTACSPVDSGTEAGEVAVCTGREPKVAACPNEDNCDGVPIGPILIESENAELDSVLSASRDQGIEEQMWINYYADRGRFSSDLRLLNDATTGWNDDYGTRFEPPAQSGIAHVWAVAHDNRGGVDWARLTVCVE